MAKLRIMVSRHSAFYSPLIGAVAAGFLKSEGFEPTYAVVPPGKSVAELVSAGEIDVAQSAVSGTFTALDKGQQPKVVHFAQINERDGFFIAARHPDAHFTWDKLAGKRVLVDAIGQPLAMFKYAAHKMGLDYNKIVVIKAGSPDEMDTAFRRGQGEYIHQQGPYPQQLQKEDIGHIVASVGKAIGPVAFSSLISTREWIQSEAAKAFTRAYRKSRKWANEAMASEIASKETEYFPKIDRDVLTETIRFYQGLGTWGGDIAIQKAHYETALDVFLHGKVISKRQPYEQVVVPPPA
ncbi:MAG: ABC transporter substrate-binding protein [Chloroflexi bacterium]|nr:ABC transporter substrate-binding protein [Chloroflexota bacterium]